MGARKKAVVLLAGQSKLAEFGKEVKSLPKFGFRAFKALKIRRLDMIQARLISARHTNMPGIDTLLKSVEDMISADIISEQDAISIIDCVLRKAGR